MSNAVEINRIHALAMHLGASHIDFVVDENANDIFYATFGKGSGYRVLRRAEANNLFADKLAERADRFYTGLEDDAKPYFDRFAYREKMKEQNDRGGLLAIDGIERIAKLEGETFFIYRISDTGGLEE